MELPVIYNTPIQEGLLEISPTEAHHLNVLRCSSGQKVILLDGCGNEGSGEIESLDKKSATILCNEVIQHKNASKKIHLAISPTKKWDRMQFLLEKCTEIGVHEITPLLADRSERKVWKTEKAQKTLINAMKQSKNHFIPFIHDSIRTADFLKTHEKSNILMAHCNNESDRTSLKPSDNNSTIIMIGPEGDFSQEEISLAHQYGAKSVTLGANRLRTETAGLYACITLQALQENNIKYNR